MNTDSVAYRYASALAEIEGQDLLTLEAELASLASVFSSNDDLKVFFESPFVPSGRKKEKLANALKGKTSPNVVNLLQLLIDKGRTVLFAEINSAFTEIVDIKYNRIRSKVTVARTFSDADNKAVLAEVEKMLSANGGEFGLDTKKKAEYKISLATDPEILGGMKLRVGDYLWDASVKTYLREWKRSVSGTEINAGLLKD